MGIRDDLERFRQIGEEQRQDLSDFIKHGEMGDGDKIKIPIKIVSLPEFEYDKLDMGGVGAGEGEVGDPVDDAQGEAGDEGEGDEAGKGEGEHGHYEMEPEEFAEELDEELGLDLDPKGKAVKEEIEGDLKELSKNGPSGTLDFERMYKKGLKRGLAFEFDEEYLEEVLKVKGIGARKAFEWARKKNIPVSLDWLKQTYSNIPEGRKGKYDEISDIDKERQTTPRVGRFKDVPLRSEDERYKYPEVTKEYEKNAVVVFMRDVSGSMGQQKRELVERVFTPMDWYLQGKYDHAEFVYIAHDVEAWEVEREDFFGIKSGGGTLISSAYKLAQKVLDEQYDWNEWNRYVFAAGDGENRRDDTQDEVIPLMEDINANLHGYLQVQPSSGLSTIGGSHAEELYDHFGNEDNNVAVTNIEEEGEVTDAIKYILSTEQNND